MLVVLAALVIHGWIAWHDDSISSFSDPFDYLFISDFYREALAGTITDATRANYRLTRFPPVFPLLLATFGAGSNQLHLASIISNATAVLAIVSVWWWLKIDIGPRRATLVALGLLFYPEWFLLNLSAPVSEPLGMVFLCTALALIAAPDPTRNRVTTAALVIGLAPLVRTALLPLIPAFMIWLALRRPFRWPVSVTAIVIATTPLLAWMGYRASLGSDSYVKSLTLHTMVEGWGGWPDALWLQPARLFAAFRDNWTGHNNGLATIASTLLIALALIGCALRLQKNKLDAWFLAGYLALILVWPFPDELPRFMVMAWPLLITCATETTASLAQFANTRAWLPLRAAPTALVALLALAIAPTARLYLHRAMLPIDPALVGEKRELGFFVVLSDEAARANAEINMRTRLTASGIRRFVGSRDCVYTTFPQYLELHSRLDAVIYPIGMDPEASAERLLTACDYYFLSDFNAVQTRQPPLFPHKALEGWTEPLMISRITLPDGRAVTAAALAKRKR